MPLRRPERTCLDAFSGPLEAFAKATEAKDEAKKELEGAKKAVRGEMSEGLGACVAAS